MGSTGAMGMAEQVIEGNISLESALLWHLRGNHYPPLPAELVPVCMRAIKAGNKEQWHKKVRLPKGMSYRGLRLVPVGDIIDSLHLDYFLNFGENND